MKKIFDDLILQSITNTKLAPIVPHGSIYEALISSIISQQISTAAARSIKNKFMSYFDGRYPRIQELESIAIDELRGLGISAQKAAYMKSVVEFYKKHDYNVNDERLLSLDDESLIKTLCEIKGVGRWTVEMILIFTLGRSDVFAIDDLGLQQSVIELYKLRKTKTLKNRILKISKQWSPNRSLASRYLWAWRDGEKKQK